MAQEYGSLTNLLSSKGKQTIVPEVGMGATQICWTDRHAFTVIEVSKSGKRCKVQADKAIRTDKNGMSECQEYTYEPDPKGYVRELSLRRDGKWKAVGTTELFRLGHREEYYDYSF